VVDLRLSGATDEDLPLIRSWLTPEMLDLIMADDLVDQRKPFLIIMIHDENDKKAGFFSVYNIDFINRKCEIGMVIGNPSNHRVKTIDALNQILDIFFNSEGMNRIYIKSLSRNIRAIKRAESVGFSIEGVERGSIFKNDHFEDVTILALLKNNFRKG
jgi:RimJ/RimL family protein N-acetyltransferase